jgi:hypothetical protein
MFFCIDLEKRVIGKFFFGVIVSFITLPDSRRRGGVCSSHVVLQMWGFDSPCYTFPPTPLSVVRSMERGWGGLEITHNKKTRPL